MNEDRDIGSAYRAASIEPPPPGLDDAIRRAARAGMPFRAKPWHVRLRAPFAIAATFVLGLGIVLRIALEHPDLAPGPAKVGHPAAADERQTAAEPPAPPTASEQAPIAPPVPGSGASAELPVPLSQERAKVLVPPERSAVADSALHKQEQSHSPGPPRAVPERAGDGIGAGAPAVTDTRNTVEPARDAATTDAAGAGRAAKSTRPEASPRRETGPETVSPALPARSAADQMRSVESAPLAAPPPAPAPLPVPRSAGESSRQQVAPAAPAAPAASRPAQSGSSEPARAASGMVGAAPRPQAEPTKTVPDVAEGALLPAQWMRHIVELRRAGREVEAEASLIRFVQRFPDYPIVPEARAARP